MFTYSMCKEKQSKPCKCVSVHTLTWWHRGTRHWNLNVHVLSSGRSLPGFDHGVPSSPPAFLSPALLWTLQTSQPGPLPGWSGGGSLWRQQHTLDPSRVIGVFMLLWATHASVSYNSSWYAAYILTWYTRVSGLIAVATGTGVRTQAVLYFVAGLGFGPNSSHIMQLGINEGVA